MLTVACVLKSGGDYGPEYVTRLQAGVATHLSLPHRFVCLTDMELPCWINTAPLEHDPPGWWSKLELFRPGLFEGRVLYFDLDTVIRGSLDEIASYDGPFAMLSDFYKPSRAASGVMAWQADVWSTDIFGAWKGAKPAGGDQVWIEQRRPLAGRLQNLFPGQITSYKAHSNEDRAKARIVCFHGLPRPHEVNWKCQAA